MADNVVALDIAQRNVKNIRFRDARVDPSYIIHQAELSGQISRPLSGGIQNVAFNDALALNNSVPYFTPDILGTDTGKYIERSSTITSF